MLICCRSILALTEWIFLIVQSSEINFHCEIDNKGDASQVILEEVQVLSHENTIVIVCSLRIHYSVVNININQSDSEVNWLVAIDLGNILSFVRLLIEESGPFALSLSHLRSSCEYSRQKSFKSLFIELLQWV